MDWSRVKLSGHPHVFVESVLDQLWTEQVDLHSFKMLLTQRGRVEWRECSRLGDGW